VILILFPLSCASVHAGGPAAMLIKAVHDQETATTVIGAAQPQSF
jgi:hypothetical protein